MSEPVVSAEEVEYSQKQQQKAEVVAEAFSQLSIPEVPDVLPATAVQERVYPPSTPNRINGIIYDIEIENCVPDKNTKRDARFKYCGGWHDHKGMGIGVLCAYDMWDRMPRIFTKGNFGEMREFFASRQEIIGFNSIKFDDEIMRALGYNVRTTYDLMAEAKIAANEPEKYERYQSKGGFKLKDLLNGNKLPPKGDHGANAPKLWQSGQIGTVIDYCMSDVMLTYKLLMKRNALYVPSYDKTFKLRELPTLRYLEVQAQEENRRNW